MAEALAAVAAVSSIVQLVDFASKVASRLKDFQSDLSEAPQSLRHLNAELHLSRDALEKVRDAMSTSPSPATFAATLSPTISGMNEMFQEIDTILAKTLPAKADGRAKRALKSISSVWKDSTVERIQNTLGRYTSTLSFYLLASSTTFQPVTGKIEETDDD